VEKWIQDLEYVIMPTRHPLKGLEKKYQAAYECWRKAWEKYRHEVGVFEDLYSDSFIIPDEMGVLFYQGRCVGLACFTYGDLSLDTTKHNSWFKGWPSSALDRLKQISPNVVIGSQFTVSPEFTGRDHIVRWKEIVFLYTFMRFDRSIGGVMAGTLNLQRKMNAAAGEDFGATIIEPEIPYHYGQGLSVQLVAYERAGLRNMINRKNIQGLCGDLWSRMFHHSEYAVIEDNVIPLKKVA